VSIEDVNGHFYLNTKVKKNTGQLVRPVSHHVHLIKPLFSNDFDPIRFINHQRVVWKIFAMTIQFTHNELQFVIFQLIICSRVKRSES